CPMVHLDKAGEIDCYFTEAGAIAGHCSRSHMPSTRRLRQVDSPRICILSDFPKNMHYPVGRYRDGGENADAAEPTGGRAKQHLSESTDMKAECRDAYPRIPDPGRGREADRRREAGAPRPPRRYADPGCFPARL